MLLRFGVAAIVAAPTFLAAIVSFREERYRDDFLSEKFPRTESSERFGSLRGVVRPVLVKRRRELVESEWRALRGRGFGYEITVLSERPNEARFVAKKERSRAK